MMKNTANELNPGSGDRGRKVLEAAGFSLVEFLLASLILLLVSMGVFGVMASVQRSSSYQTEVQAVLDNTRIAMDTVSHILEQAGNDPKGSGFPGVTITSATQVRVRSDLTGSAGANSDKGDPDGDTLDSGEDLTIQYNSSTRSIELLPGGGGAQAIATNIAAFSMRYFDATGAPTSVGADVRKVTVTLTGASILPDPETKQVFSQRVTSDVQLATRK